MELNEIAYIFLGYTPLLDQPEEFNTRMNWGSMQRYFQCITTKDFESLRPFKVLRGENGVPPIHFVNGHCDIPKDYQIPEKMYYYLDEEQIEINILDDNQFEILKTNALTKPTPEEPIANIQSNYIRLLPRSIKFVVFSYVRKPKEVKYVVSNALGYAKYDSVNSVQLEWDEYNQISIILIVLESLGIVATREEIQSKKK